MPLLLCPNDNAPMQTVQRAGVEFDICPTCRGVWLDRGELENLIGAATQPPTASEDYRRPEPPRQAPYAGQHDDHRYRDDHRHREHRWDDDHYRHKKRKGLDIFDIFD